MLLRPRALAPILMLMTAACHGGHGTDVPGNSEDHRPFHGIAADETVHFAGTEPFWGGQVDGGRLLWTTPDSPKGTAVAVTRFAGRGGVSFSGRLGDQPFEMMVTAGSCSDGMSDRRYPYQVTVQIGSELRQGCGWTAGQGRAEAS